jgi:enoyl-CoA hydratase/carnithine racemase
MSDYTGFREIGVSLDGLVATVEIRRPPHNFFDSALIAEIGEAFERLDADPACRTIVLAAEGRSFCAGAISTRRRFASSAPRSRLSERSTARRSAAA